MRRTLSVLLALIGLVLVSVQPANAAATANQPILFVHGYDSNGSTWNTMLANFTANGYTDAELFPVSYNARQGNAVTAQQMVGVVDRIRAQTGWATIDIVTHSMGGLSSRYYLKNLGGTSTVDEWVSLGGPNHGTKTRGCASTTVARTCDRARRSSPSSTPATRRRAPSATALGAHRATSLSTRTPASP